MKIPFKRRPKWDTKTNIRRYKIALFASLWTIILILPVYAILRSFPFNADAGDIVHVIGRFAGLFGFLLISFSIFSRNLFSQLKKLMEPIKFYNAILIIEILGLTLIFSHPLFLVWGRVLMGYMNPFEILIPKFTNAFYINIAFGCVAFWYMFVAGIILLRRNTVKLNRNWKPFYHFLMYFALFLSLTHAHNTGTSASLPTIDIMYNIIYLFISFSIIYKITEIMLRLRKKLLEKLKHK